MPTFQQALAALQDKGMAVHHLGGPTRPAFVEINGQYYRYSIVNPMSADLKKYIRE